MLCELCKTIKFPWPISFTPEQEASFIHPEDCKIFFTHYYSVQEVADSAERGCHLCSQLAHGLQSSLRLPPAEKDYRDSRGPVRLVYSGLAEADRDGRPKSFEVVLDGDRERVGSLTLDEMFSGVKLPEGKLLSMPSQALDIVNFGDSLSNILKEKPTGESHTGSRANMLLVREWMRECFEGSHWCRFNLQQMPQLPTRVIDVGPPDGSKEPVLHISNGETGYYLALSHCWGSTQIITTRTATLEERINGIPLNSLSKTFQDAVLVTRNLGWKFLWIDSLCILQDSRDDWEKESAKMGQYYKNSFLTVAAVSAKNGTEGCFRNRNVLQVTPCPVPAQGDTLRDPNVDGCFIRPTWPPEQGENSSEAARHAPLDSRAWAFQERIMSPRVLQFEKYQMTFSCYDGRASEQYPEFLPNLSFRSVPFENERREFGDFEATMAMTGRVLSPEKDKARNDEKKREVWRYWRNLICSYSGLDITYKTDVLPALSGLASQIATITEGSYLAGLWKEDIHRELLWTKEFSSSAPHFDQEPPTWSWTSTQQEGTNRQGYMNYLLDGDLHWDNTCFLLLEARMTIPGANPYGKPSEGVLRVNGYLKKAIHYINPLWPKSMGGQKYNLIDNDKFIGSFYPDRILTKGVKSGNGMEIWCCPVLTKNGPMLSSSGDDTKSRAKAQGALPKVGETDKWLEIINYFTDEGYFSTATIKPTGDDYVEADNRFREHEEKSDEILKGMIEVVGLALVPTGVRPGEMVRVGRVDMIRGCFDACPRVEFTII